MRKILSSIFLGFFTTLVLAEVEVVDYSTDANLGEVKSYAPSSVDASGKVSSPVVTGFPKTAANVGKPVSVASNPDTQNMSREIEELRESVQKLNGQVESQAHQIEQLNTQLKGFYQDLNQRLGGVPSKEVAISPVAQTSPGVVNSPPTSSSIVAATPSNIAGAFAGGEVKKGDQSQSAPKNDSAFLQEQQMYQTAIDLLPEKKHESESKLRAYLKQYPKGVYVANAHYWLGEINFLQKNFDAAEEEFKIVVDKYSKSKRVADALFKLALVHQNQGRDQQAKTELKKVVKSYPGTSAARLAEQQLAGS